MLPRGEGETPLAEQSAKAPAKSLPSGRHESYPGSPRSPTKTRTPSFSPWKSDGSASQLLPIVFDGRYRAALVLPKRLGKDQRFSMAATARPQLQFSLNFSCIVFLGLQSVRMKCISLLGILGIAAILAPKAVLARNVTWGATGLPPGMSIMPVNSTTANITGTPTTPGNYTPVVFPKIGNAIGDMVSFRLTILPVGMDLPIYYPYNRTAPGEEWLSARGGGNGAILLQGDRKKIYFTTNGTNFTEASFQSATPSGYPEKAEFAGSRCLVKFGNPSALYYSDNRTAFRLLNFPSDLTGGGSLVSNRSNRFFLIEGSKIWSLQSNQTTWKAGSLPFNNGSFTYSNFTMAANGNLLVLACAYNNDPVSLFYSTNSGDTWILSPTNPGIVNVVYGNGMFLGSGISGVWKSTNGINWQKVSSLSDVTNLVFSAPENLFFSNIGVSKDGLYWVGYGDWLSAGSSDPWVSSGTGLIFRGNQQFTLTKIPRLYHGPLQSNKATANKPASFQIQVSQ